MNSFPTVRAAVHWDTECARRNVLMHNDSLGELHEDNTSLDCYGHFSSEAS